MQVRKLLQAVAASALLANLPLAHAANDSSSMPQQPATTQQPATEAPSYMDDAGITTKVKAKFLADKIVSGINVKVETKHGIVYLSGKAKSEQEKQRATELAMSTEGVQDVKNDIQIQAK